MMGHQFHAGTGFTMALFVSSLALSEDLLDAAKTGSVLSATVGVIMLVVSLPKPSKDKYRPLGRTGSNFRSNLGVCEER
jgi:Na+/H+ antiporter NhaA